jgi:hypothetical protein
VAQWVLEGDVLELGVELVVLGDHLVVLEDLLGHHLLRLLPRNIGTGGSFFSIFFFRSFWRVFPWYSSFIFSRWYYRRIPLISLV